MTETIDKVIRKHFVTHQGKQVEVRSNSTVDHYPSETLIFENKLVKGAKAGTSEYWVPVKDFIPSPRQGASSVKSSMLADMKSGMSVEELAKKYNVEVQ